MNYISGEKNSNPKSVNLSQFNSMALGKALKFSTHLFLHMQYEEFTIEYFRGSNIDI